MNKNEIYIGFLKKYIHDNSVVTQPIKKEQSNVHNKKRIKKKTKHMTLLEDITLCELNQNCKHIAELLYYNFN